MIELSCRLICEDEVVGVKPKNVQRLPVELVHLRVPSGSLASAAQFILIKYLKSCWRASWASGGQAGVEAPHFPQPSVVQAGLVP